MTSINGVYDYSQDNKVLAREPDSDTEPDYDRSVNASTLENGADVKGDFGIKAKSESEMKGNPLFQKKETGEGVKWMAVKPWKGAIVAPSNAPKNNPAAPDKSLVLEWAHGYRGWDARSNLVYNKPGNIVYPIAGVGVVYDAKKNAQTLFMGHTDHITCLAQNPADPNLVATGQVATITNRRATDPHICIWDTTDIKKSWTIPKAGKRAIRSVAFSPDGKLLTSVANDNDQTVTVWDWQAGKKIAEEKGDTNLIYQVRWNHKSANEFVTVGDKHIYFWSLDGGRLKKTKAQMGGKYPWQLFASVTFSEKGYACCGGSDGSLYVFVNGLAKVVKKIHSKQVAALDWYAGGLVSGGTDKQVVVLDKTVTATKTFSFPNKIASVFIQGDDLLVGTQGGEIYEVKQFLTANADLSNAVPLVRGHFDGETWALAVHPDGKTFITAGEDNRIYHWDIPSHKLIKQTEINDKAGVKRKVKKAATDSMFPPNQCVRAVAISPDGKEFAVGTNEGEVHVLRTGDFKRVASHDLNKLGKRQVTNQTENWIQVMKYSPTGKTLAVGTHGQVVCLLDPADGYKPKGTLTAHNSFITHMDWSKDGKNLQTNCGAYELLFHDINEADHSKSKQNTSASALKDVQWATQTCILGWSVQGVFDPNQDGTDVNSLDVSADRSLIATGDDYGNVNLFRYPAAADAGTNQQKRYEGHSAHVVTVRFTPDQSRVLSTGGGDRAVLVWRVQ